MINRILRRLKFEVLQLNVKSFTQLKKTRDFQKLDQAVLTKNREFLKPYYDQYISEVSRADMAISLEMAVILYSICSVCNFSKLLDMGSGLSSLILRLYAKEHSNVVVFSVDDDEKWLEKTRLFLAQHGVTSERTFLVQEFNELHENEFDFVLCDLNFVEERIKYTEQIMTITRENGVVIFDDIHKADYLHPLLSRLQKFKTDNFSLKEVTLDAFGRYALAVIKR